MELWQSLLVAFGGNATVLLVLGFLGRSLMSGILAKDVERFKAELQVAAIEHQVRFSKLHEKRAEVLAELYTLLVAATWATTNFASPMQWAGDPDKKTQYRNAINSIAEYFRFFETHRIWLPLEICGPLEEFAKQLRDPTVRLGVYFDIEYPNKQTLKERGDVWEKAWESAEKEVPALRAGIEREFRALLSARSQEVV